MAENKEELNEDATEQDQLGEPPEIDSKYRMIILAAQRSKQLQRGAVSRTDVDTRKTKPTRVALKELNEKKVNFEILEQSK
jgi:DNA-directed RNA polymerase omega subunit